MKGYTVYLAGPISGCTFAECTDWREAFKRAMPDFIECLSPTRGKQHLAGCTDAPAPKIDDDLVRATMQNPAAVLCTDAAIVGRDYFDCCRADVVVFNMLGATQVSIGTCMEVAWAYALHKPTVFVMEPPNADPTKKCNLHDHAMIRRAITHWTYSLEHAQAVVRAILDTRSTPG